MRSSGGVASLAEAAAHRGAARCFGPGRRRGRRGRGRAARRVRGRDRVRHGRHVDRRLRDRSAARRRARAERLVGGLPDPAADARRAHRRRGRRLDRLARRGRGAARRARERGRRAGAGLLRPRRHAADGDRREPASRPAAGPPRGRARARPGRGRARPRRHRPGRGRVAVVERRDARARCASSRSSAATTRATSRSSPSAARARCTRARWRRSSGSGPCSCRRRRACSPRSAWPPSDERRDDVRIARRPLEEARRAAGRGRGRPPLLRPVVRADGAARRRTWPRLSTAAHEERYGYADRARPLELVAVRTAECARARELALHTGAPPDVVRRQPWSSSTARPAGSPRVAGGLGMDGMTASLVP